MMAGSKTLIKVVATPIKTVPNIKVVKESTRAADPRAKMTKAMAMAASADGRND